MLNFARRHAEKIEIKKEKHSIYVNPILLDFLRMKNIDIDGTNPKETMSARESNSFPNLLFFFISFAINPSRKSKTIEIIVAMLEDKKSSENKNIIEILPKNRFNNVKIFGIIPFIFSIIKKIQ